MLQKVHIEHFQSLHDVELELAPLTVIVGPSSSGKSALTRALRTLTSNARGTAFISHGEQTCTITAHTDKGIVSLSRGKKDEYTLIPSHSEKKNFTKLGGAVPEEVSEFIGIPAKDPLNYSSQFDMPYLLTSSAGEVARTLGELTNVHVIFEASREANRQRLTHTQTLKTRAGDLEATRESLARFTGLAEQQAAIHDAQEHYTGAVEIQQRLARLQQYARTAREAAEALASIRQHTEELPNLTTLHEAHRRLVRLTALIAQHQAAAESLAKLPAEMEIPSVSSLQAANKKLQRLRELSRSARAAAETRAAAQSAVTTRAYELSALQHDYKHALQNAGTCPMCGQSTKEIRT